MIFFIKANWSCFENRDVLFCQALSNQIAQDFLILGAKYGRTFSPLGKKPKLTRRPGIESQADQEHHLLNCRGKIWQA